MCHLEIRLHLHAALILSLFKLLQSHGLSDLCLEQVFARYLGTIINKVLKCEKVNSVGQLIVILNKQDR